MTILADHQTQQIAERNGTTFVSWTSDQGAREELIADPVGHRNTTTRTVYRHQLRPVITEGAELLAEVFAEDFFDDG
ncbi:hypothetical protein [Glycomyces xiaoerkulensis]|uniref:hypothetical protein n=1 Tax=Glycomyces xiaoerkulensis TaxID=2038139 RepID=UPI000C263AB1|nr:hypothetical protein [Glycomyces xiaoerkulensis]